MELSRKRHCHKLATVEPATLPKCQRAATAPLESDRVTLMKSTTELRSPMGQDAQERSATVPVGEM
jgi:hypothetical protein